MPIDPNIALNANAPKPENPLQTALQVAQFRAYNANGLAAQQQLNANAATSRAYQQSVDPTTGQLDTNKLSAALAGDPDAAYNYAATMKNVMDARQAQQTLSSNQMDQAQKAQTALRQGLGSLLTKQDLSPQDVQGFAATQLQSGAITPQVYQAEMQSLPQDPAQLRPWVAQHFQSALSGEQQLTNMKPSYNTVNTGPANVAINQNPNAIGANGQPIPVGSVGYTVNNGLSPTEAAAQVPVVNADGSQGTRSKASVLQAQGLGGLLPPAAQGGANGRYPGNGGTVQTSPAAGVVDATQKANAAGGDQWVADQTSNAASNTRLNMLGNALTALQGAQTGEGADKLQAIRSTLVTLGVANQDQADKVQNFDEANKYLTQYAQQKAAGFGHGTDAQLAASISGNGNTHISNLAAQDVVRVNVALERMEQARTAAFQQQLDAGSVKASDYSSWKSKFGSTMDPRVFIADQLPLAKTQAMVSGMKPSEQQQFKTQYNWAVQNGYINGPQ